MTCIVAALAGLGWGCYALACLLVSAATLVTYYYHVTEHENEIALCRGQDATFYMEIMVWRVRLAWIKLAFHMVLLLARSSRMVAWWLEQLPIVGRFLRKPMYGSMVVLCTVCLGIAIILGSLVPLAQSTSCLRDILNRFYHFPLNATGLAFLDVVMQSSTHTLWLHLWKLDLFCVVTWALVFIARLTLPSTAFASATWWRASSAWVRRLSLGHALLSPGSKNV